jgi:hypothetical protein
MTFVGKLFVMVNLAISFIMAVTAFGLYVTNLDYDAESRKSTTPQPPAKYTAAQKEIEGLRNSIPAVKGSWRVAYNSLLDRDDQRRQDKQWYDKELAFARNMATADNPVKEVVLAKHLPVPDAVNKMRPTMQPIAGLASLATYTAQLEAERKENAGVLERLQKQIDEDIRLTNLLTGTTDPFTKGLRQLLVDERIKREGVIAEYNSVEPLRILIVAESDLVSKRLASMLERIAELKAYLKAKHKVDVAMKGR